MSNKINTRVQNKHDMKKNWDKATNFIPLEGELILYDENTAAGGTPIYKVGHAIKIGNGITPVKDLPYFLSLKTSPAGGLYQFNVPEKNTEGEWTGNFIDCTAGGSGAIAFGLNTNASGKAALALGENTKARGSYSLTMGLNTMAGDPDGSITGTVDSGIGCIALGKNSIATGFYSLSFGNTATTSAGKISQISMGQNSKTNGTAAIAIGNENQALAPYAAVFGNTNYSCAAGSFVTGQGNIVQSMAVYSAALGTNNTLTGKSSISFGRQNIVDSAYGVALGYQNHLGDFIVDEDGSIVSNNTVYSTIALGYNNKVQSSYACAFGIGLQVLSGSHNNAQVVLGRFNAPVTSKSAYALVVGNGNSDTERSNCHMLKNTGQAWYSDSVYVGGSGLEDTSGALQKLSTEKYVNDLIGDIDSALEEIIALQQNYINGGIEA